MLAVAVACMQVFLTGREIVRWKGGVFVLYYVAYFILAAQQHDALHTYTLAMTGFVLPLKVSTLVAVLLRGRTTPA
jgi:cation:H+ antiporter